MLTTLLALPEKPSFQRFIIGVILFNAFILGLLTIQGLNENLVVLLETLDATCLGIFCVELTLKLLGQRLKFFSDGWNIFDFLVVAVALAPATGSLAVLRAMRVFRVMRLVTSVPSMQRVLNGMFSAIPGAASVAGVLLIIFYVSAIMATNFFSEVDPANFGHLGLTFFTLFQFLTMEGWPDIARPVMEKMPYAWMFFIPFILLTTLTTLNLLFGIIVDAMESAKEEEARDSLAGRGISMSPESNEMRLAIIEQEVRGIRGKIAALSERIDRG